MNQLFDDPNYQGIFCRIGASGLATPVIRGTGIRVQTIVVDTQMGLTPEQIAMEYEIDIACVLEALAYYDGHRPELDADIHTEQELAGKHHFP